MEGSFQPVEVASDQMHGVYVTVPAILWSFDPCSRSDSTRLMDLAFKRWKSAERLGFKLRSLTYNGLSLSDRQVDLCNQFVSHGDIVAAAKLHHWDAVRLFEKIIT